MRLLLGLAAACYVTECAALVAPATQARSSSFVTGTDLQLAVKRAPASAQHVNSSPASSLQRCHSSGFVCKAARPATRLHSSNPAATEPDAKTTAEGTALARTVHNAVRAWEQQKGETKYKAAVDRTFAPEQLPAEVLAAVAAASEQVRVAAYIKLLTFCAGRANYLNLVEARTARKSAAVLCPRKGSAAATSKGAGAAVDELAITEANMAVAKTLVKALEAGYDDQALENTGAWLLFLFDFMENRPVEHKAKDEEAVGMFFDMITDEEKQAAKSKKAAKMFADSMTAFLPATKLAHDITAEQWPDVLADITQGVQDMFIEVKPSREDAIYYLRVKGRICIADLIKRSSNLLAVQLGVVDSNASPAILAATKSEAMSSEQLLGAAMGIARLVLDSIIQLYNAFNRVTMEGYIEAADEHLAATAGEYSRAVTLWGGFVGRYVASALSGAQKFDTTSKFEPLLLRRLLSMSGSLARTIAIQQYGEQLGKSLIAVAAEESAAGTAVDSSSKLVRCLPELDEMLELPKDLKGEVRDVALKVYMQQYVDKGVSYTPDDAGRWVCDFLGLPHARLEVVLNAERSRAFGASLDRILRVPSGDAPSGTSGWRYTELEPEELQAVQLAAEQSGLTPAQARAGAAEELKPLLKSLIARAAESMRSEQQAAATQTLLQIDSTLSGLASQLLEGLGDAPPVPQRHSSGGDPDAALVSHELCLKGLLSEVQEFWTSELCWHVIDAGEESDAEGAANRVLDLIGIK